METVMAVKGRVMGQKDVGVVVVEVEIDDCGYAIVAVVRGS
jgi:hypothetical protein